MKNFFVHSPVLVLCAAIMGALIQPGYSAPKSKYSALPTRTKQGANLAAKSILDSATVHKYYLDGDFEEAIAILETGLKEKRPFNHNDSVFIFKHLGVMYAAQYESREKGKYYMHQLLMTEPTAKIMDMYASDMIYMIFKNIQDEFDTNRMRLAKAEDLVKGNSQTEPNRQEPEQHKAIAGDSNGHTVLWVGATAAVVAVGVGAYFLLSNGPKTTDSDHGF